VQFRERGSNVYDRCRLSNPSLEIDKSEDFRTHRLPFSITRESEVRIKFFSSHTEEIDA
jgi:hypothetical protein